jgi:aconitase A
VLRGRFEDFLLASRIMRGRKLKEGVRCIAVPASKEVQMKLIDSGLMRSLLEFGCTVGPPTCGPCIGAVIASSFARIFYRNAVNVGLPVIEAEIEADQWDIVKVYLEEGKIENITKSLVFTFKSFPREILEIFEEGGIVEYFRKRGKFPWE